MSSLTPSQLRLRAENRRSRRWHAFLPVDLHYQGAVQHLRATDVGRHGLYVVMEDAPPERLVVRLVITLPTGPMDVTACISHRRSNAGMNGMGLHFFALSSESKRHWEDYLDAISGHSPAVRRDDEPESSAFFIKPRDIPRLKNFKTQHLDTGGMRMATPVLKDVGAAVTLVVVHPQTANEYLVHGVVDAVQRERPKGMNLRFLGVTEESKAAFDQFVLKGESYLPPPTLPPPPPAEPPPTDEPSLELDITVEDILEDTPYFGWDPAAEPQSLGFVGGGLIPLIVGEPLGSSRLFQDGEPSPPAPATDPLAETPVPAPRPVPAAAAPVLDAAPVAPMSLFPLRPDPGTPEQVQTLNLALEGWRRLVVVLESQLVEVRQGRDELRRERNDARTEVAALKVQLAQLEERYRVLEASVPLIPRATAWDVKR